MSLPVEIGLHVDEILSQLAYEVVKVQRPVMVARLTIGAQPHAIGSEIAKGAYADGWLFGHVSDLSESYH
jgi:hypothetical protein